MKNPFYTDSGKLNFESINKHLGNYGSFVFDQDKNILRKYNGSYWQIYENWRIEKKIREIVGEDISENGLQNSINKFKSRFSISIEDSKANYKGINLKNGTLSLSDYKLYPHDEDDYFLHRLNIEYDPNAINPTWENYLSDVTESDPEMIKVIQEMFGYCLIPGNEHQKVFFLFGPGGNGKSVLLEVLRNIIGKQNTCSISLTQLSNNFIITQLVGKLANICDESPDSKAIESEFFKNLTAGGTFTADVKFGQPFLATCEAKFIFATNSVLKTRDHSDALHRRLVIIPFNYSVKKEKRDIHLVSKLLKELPGILNWSLEGLKRLRKKGDFSDSQSIKLAKEEFIRGMDNVKAFLDEHCVVGADKSIGTQELFESYKDFANSNGYQACSMTTFGNRIRVYHPAVERIRLGAGHRPYVFTGIDVAT